jgi:hypothetical protein
MPINDFTYNAYKEFLDLISKSGYSFATYHNWTNYKNPCILRHDIDCDILRAYALAKFEAAKQIQSTYFVLLKTDMYNAFSESNIARLKEMMVMRHEIGLHFDEHRYYQNGCDSAYIVNTIAGNIRKEIKILELILENPVKCVSMHCPSRIVLKSNISIDGVKNSYSKQFFNDFHYISDSSHHWREDAESIIRSGKYKKLHILTHPIWYTEKKETYIVKLLRFIREVNKVYHREIKTIMPNLYGCCAI